ncbi:MAG: hypothetical protein AAB647_03070 [Patescibacteria group bacterium]
MKASTNQSAGSRAVGRLLAITISWQAALLAMIVAIALAGCGGGGGGTGGGGNSATSSTTSTEEVWKLLVDSRAVALAAAAQKLDPLRFETALGSITDGAGGQFNEASTPGVQGGLVTTYTDKTGADYNIGLVETDANGVHVTSKAGVIVCNASGNQWNSACVVWPNGNKLVAWQDLRSGVRAHVYYQIYTSGNLPLLAANGVEVPVPNAININEQVQPRVALTSNGNVALALYEVGSTQQVLTYLINSTGGYVWPETWRIVAEGDPAYDDLRIAADNGNGFAVVCQRKENAADENSRNLIGQGFNSAGVPQMGVGPKLLSLQADGVTAAPGRQFRGDLTFDGTNFGLVFVDERSGVAVINGLVISKAGVFQTPAEGKVISTSAGQQDLPSIAADSGGFTIGWDNRGAGTHIATVSRRNGTLSDAANETVVADVQVAPNVKVVASDEATATHIIHAGIDTANGKPDGRYQYLKPDGQKAYTGQGLQYDALDGASESNFNGVKSSAKGAFIVSMMKNAGDFSTATTVLVFRKQVQ